MGILSPCEPPLCRTCHRIPDNMMRAKRLSNTSALQRIAPLCDFNESNSRGEGVRTMISKRVKMKTALNKTRENVSDKKLGKGFMWLKGWQDKSACTFAQD
jgi:hypothetical protein